MRIIFMGTPEFSVPVLDALVNAGHEVLCAYCQPPRPAGRGKKDRPTPVHARAKELGITVRHPVSLRTEDALTEFAALQADVAVVVAYGLILPQPILEAPKLGCLNIHASLLPRWRGAAPIHRAVLSGDAQTGVCIMQMEAGLDTGPVLQRAVIDIDPEETTAALHDRLSQLGAVEINDVLGSLTSLTPMAQPEVGVSYASKIDKSEARIDWTLPAIEVDRLIRGLSAFPGAWTMQGETRIKLLGSRVSAGAGVPGTVLLDPLRVVCGCGAVELTRLQRAGKGPQDAETFLNGWPFEQGRILEGAG
ncbi:MAG: methionyl-tRNA formyltransferase [Roseobacter sp.]